MADKKITQLSGATTPLTGTEELAIVQGGSTVKATAQDVADLAGAPYLVYTALLTQSGTNAPVATVLENTVSNPLFSYSQVGAYLFNCDDITNTAKTNFDQPVYYWLNIATVDQEATVKVERTNDNEVNIYVRNDGSQSNDYLNGFYFELLIWD